MKHDLGDKTIGTLIRDYRKQKNLSLGQFAKQCGISKTYIYTLENGKPSGEFPSPTLNSLVALANTMEMSLLQLLIELGTIDSTSKSANQNGSDNAIEPFERIPLTQKNLNEAVPEGRLILLPFRPPRLNELVYTPIYSDPYMVTAHNVTAVYGGVFEAWSETFDIITFTLFDINKSVFLTRKEAAFALEAWRRGKRTQKTQTIPKKRPPLTWRDSKSDFSDD